MVDSEMLLVMSDYVLEEIMAQIVNERVSLALVHLSLFVALGNVF